ncbi:hypothetical protein [Desulfofalx alkaliphila]|nr:hypothetical protein [Desulfofalx alkaliphila]
MEIKESSSYYMGYQIRAGEITMELLLEKEGLNDLPVDVKKD